MPMDEAFISTFLVIHIIYTVRAEPVEARTPFDKLRVDGFVVSFNDLIL